MSDAVRDTERKLERRIDLDFTDAKLADLLQFLAEFGEVAFDARDLEAGDKTITFQVRDLALRHVLGLLLRQYEFEFTVAEDGRLAVGPAGTLVVTEAEKARSGLRRAGEMDAGDEGPIPCEGDRDLEQRLRDMNVSLNFDSTSLEEAMAFLREITGVNLVLDQRSPVDPEARIHVSLEGISAEAATREVARQAGRDVWVENGIVILAGMEEVAGLRAEREQRVRRVEGLLSRRVQFGGAGLPAWRLPDVLQEQTGARVVVSESVWLREGELAVPLGGRTLRETMNYVAAQAGLQWRLVEGVIYLY